MRFAAQAKEPELAQRLRLMAGEYLVKAEEAESQMVSGAAGTPASGLDLQSAAPEEPS
jgi:hypothetical protein